jgi:hypothetical protein
MRKRSIDGGNQNPASGNLVRVHQITKQFYGVFDEVV